MKALGKYLLISPITEEKKGKLILTHTKTKVVYWKVLSVGPEVNGIREGQKICICNHSAHEIDTDENLTYIHIDYVVATDE
jgi:hypothetical protein